MLCGEPRKFRQNTPKENNICSRGFMWILFIFFPSPFSWLPHLLGEEEKNLSLSLGRLYCEVKGGGAITRYQER